MVEDIACEHPGQPIELWFQDEMRVGQKGTLTRVWAATGEHATAPRDLRFGYAYLSGALCPARDTGAAIVMPMVNTIAMNEHLVEIGRWSARARTPCWSSTAPAGIHKRGWPGQSTSPCCFCRHTAPNSTRSRSCGTDCADTSSPTASSTLSKTWSRPAATLGTPPY